MQDEKPSLIHPHSGYRELRSYPEEDLLPLSALQHYLFCKRQCALIHIEQVWAENLFTAEGRLLHEHVDTAGGKSKGDVRIEYSVPIRSFRLGLIGKADVVEFRRYKDGWLPFPVEYKRGRPKRDHTDRVQLCAQAICLEEMMDVEIKEGALFYGKTRRRQAVRFDETLREETFKTSRSVHELINSGLTPSPEYGKKCKNCSLIAECMPESSGKKLKVKNYLNRILREI